MIDQGDLDDHEPLLLNDVKRWLDIYFQGMEPDFNIPLHITGSDFQEKVWSILLKIPYGQTITYGEIAKEIAEEEGIPKMSAQAVGGVIGHNKISIIILKAMCIDINKILSETKVLYCEAYV